MGIIVFSCQNLTVNIFELSNIQKDMLSILLNFVFAFIYLLISHGSLPLYKYFPYIIFYYRFYGKFYENFLIYYRKCGINILSGTQETFEALSHFLYNLEVTLKEYKTNEQLIEYLISKNLIIEDKEKALRNIERYSYYSIVNGYKSVFKNEDNNYKPNVTFEEIFALYEFDKNIKAIFLKFTLEIEVIIKSLMANTLAEKYGVQDYLKIENFDKNANEDFKNNLIENINKEIDDNYNKHTAIKHYKDTYNFIPPFVLTKILTFGAISRYYGLLKQNDRQEISKYFKISDKLLKQILVNLTIIRNISAHSDRLFCYRNKYYISFKNIDKNYKKNGNYTNIYMMIECMKVLLDEDKFQEFQHSFDTEVDKLKGKLNSININDILRIMGFNV